MVHAVKNIKTKLPPLQIRISFWLRLALFSAVIGGLYACGATFSTILGIYVGYKILRLTIRFFGLLLSIVYTAVSIVILILIISYIIF